MEHTVGGSELISQSKRYSFRIVAIVGASLMALGCSDAEPTAPLRAALTPETDWEYKLIINEDEGRYVVLYTDTPPSIETAQLGTSVNIPGEVYCPTATDQVQKKYRDNYCGDETVLDELKIVTQSLVHIEEQ